jgi:hypothetical protein
MKVDNKTNVPFNDKRNTVRISTKDRFAVGSVWIADMLHVPFGVSLVVVVSTCLVVPINLAAYHKKEPSRGSYRRVSRGFFGNLRQAYILYHAYTDARALPSVCV